jgi:glycosyltransferase involved in cell wall biosynthesis
MKKILWITPKWTYPAVDGARVASEKLISELSQFDLQLDYISFSHPEDKVDIGLIQEKYKISNAYSFNRDLPMKLLNKIMYYLIAFILHPLTPLTLSSFNKKSFKNKVNELISSNNYDGIVLDGLHVAKSLDQNIYKQYKVYLRAHNVESDIWKRAALDTQNPIKRIFLNWQYKLMKKFESLVLSQVSKAFAISEEDNARLKELAPNSSIETILLGMNFDKVLNNKMSDRIELLFLGRLDWPPNKDGLRWFLDNVWPKLNHDSLHLNIAGSGNRSWLIPYSSDDNITLHGFVDDILDLYTLSDICLIPIFYGSGTRIKVVEAVSLKRAMISTKMGVMGAGLEAGEDYILAETAQDWIKELNELNKDKLSQLSENAFNKIKNTYDQKVIAEKLYSLL